VCEGLGDIRHYLNLAAVMNWPKVSRHTMTAVYFSGERTGAFRSKVSKDLAQAASLMEYFRDNDPEALRAAWFDALGRGPGWKKRALDGSRTLRTHDHELASLLSEDMI
jgi:hypothetical protein